MCALDVPQIVKIGDGQTTAALKTPATRFLLDNIVIQEGFCIVASHSKVREENQEVFKELLAEDDDGENCIMSNLGPKGSGTTRERRNAAFSNEGPDVYNKGAMFL